jgi:hypothetical protein
VGSNGEVTLKLVTDRRYKAHEFWLFDFQSHYDADFLVGGNFWPSRTGSCSNVRDELSWPTVFDETDGTTENTNSDFDPVSSSGLLDEYVIGEWPKSPVEGTSIRQDTLSFTGPVDKLLNCNSTFAQYVFQPTKTGNQVALEGFAFASCVRPRSFIDPQLGVSVVEKKFLISIRMSQRVDGISVKAVDGDTAIREARYNLAFVEPYGSSISGNPLTGAAYSTIFFDYDTVAYMKSEASMYNMLNVTSIKVNEGKEMKLITVDNLADSADGKCYLEDERCKQHFYFSVLVATPTSLQKALNSKLSRDKIVTGQFVVTCETLECDSKILSPTSCRTSGQEAKVVIEIKIFLDFSIITMESKVPQMLMYGLRHYPDRTDARNEILKQGERLVLQSWIAPADTSLLYNATLTRLTLCKKSESDTCNGVKSNDVLVYYGNGIVDQGVASGYVESDKYRIYEVFFTVRRFSQDELHTLEATYSMSKLDGSDGGAIESSFSVVIVQACPQDSTPADGTCVCDSGFRWKANGNICIRDSEPVDPTEDPNASKDPIGTTEPQLPPTKPVKGSGVSPVVYIGVTLFMVIAAIYI